MTVNGKNATTVTTVTTKLRYPLYVEYISIKLICICLAYRKIKKMVVAVVTKQKTHLINRITMRIRGCNHQNRKGGYKVVTGGCKKGIT